MRQNSAPAKVRKRIFAEDSFEGDISGTMKNVVALRMTQFGQTGHAGDYSPIDIVEIAKGYMDGSLFTRPLVAAK